jgi:gamma-glutamyl-gamma-aminobutyrate hydrolase PuuD
MIRDEAEERMWNKAQQSNLAVLGICRGSQFVCAKSGGKLIQHCDNHTYNHSIITRDNRVLEMTSTHHQMMYPWDTKHELIAWAPRRSPQYVFDGDIKHDLMEREPEIVFFPETRALAVQGHPEYFSNKNHATVAYIRSIVKDLLLKRKFI